MDPERSTTSSATVAATTSALTNFTPFPRLPPELRQNVWHHAIPQQHLVCQPTCGTQFVSHAVWPSELREAGCLREHWEVTPRPLIILRVCRESRAVALTTGRFAEVGPILHRLFDEDGNWESYIPRPAPLPTSPLLSYRPRTIWFSNARDTLILGPSPYSINWRRVPRTEAMVQVVRALYGADEQESRLLMQPLSERPRGRIAFQRAFLDVSRQGKTRNRFFRNQDREFMAVWPVLDLPRHLASMAEFVMVLQTFVVHPTKDEARSLGWEEDAAGGEDSRLVDIADFDTMLIFLIVVMRRACKVWGQHCELPSPNHPALVDYVADASSSMSAGIVDAGSRWRSCLQTKWAGSWDKMGPLPRHFSEPYWDGWDEGPTPPRTKKTADAAGGVVEPLFVYAPEAPKIPFRVMVLFRRCDRWGPNRHTVAIPRPSVEASAAAGSEEAKTQ